MQETPRPVSRAFEGLLTSLGWFVNPAEHLGFRNERYADKTGSPPPARMLYYANAFEEVHFYVPEIENAGLTPREWLHRVKAAGGMPSVLVLWNACSQQFAAKTQYYGAYGAPKAYYYIIIDSLPNKGLYRIR